MPDDTPARPGALGVDTPLGTRLAVDGSHIAVVVGDCDLGFCVTAFDPAALDRLVGVLQRAALVLRAAQAHPRAFLPRPEGTSS